MCEGEGAGGVVELGLELGVLGFDGGEEVVEAGEVGGILEFVVEVIV